jgi:ubiquinone/menaquinone biosynthesis C-methylase UbiE
MIAPYRQSGIVLDIGTGDGRFVSSSAKADPEKFYIGIDANAKPLEKLSMKATRKPAKGGLRNAMFVQAAAEDLPEELNGVASEIFVNFPWGSLLRAVAIGDPDVLGSLRSILHPGGSLTITIGIDPIRESGLEMREAREISMPEWSHIETSWARKLGGNDGRKVFRLRFVRN